MSRKDCSFKTADGEFHYIDWGGEGPVSHFAHATGLCAGVYTPLAERLASRLKIFGMDDRGHGKTTAAADPKALRDWNVFASDLEKFFETLNEPVIAMGHSRGATASLLLAAKRPDLIRALILVDPTILPYSWTWGWAIAKSLGLSRRIPIAAKAAKRKNGWPEREHVLASYKKKAVFRSWTDGFLEAYVNDGTCEAEDGTIKLCCEPDWESRCFSVCPHDVWRYIPQLQQPTLILYGAESDTFLAPSAKRFKAEVPHARVQKLEATGHFVPMERPDETAKAIVSFLDDDNIT
jgi:pimeloyl-ACP methyl ester carboxylesterase